MSELSFAPLIVSVVAGAFFLPLVNGTLGEVAGEWVTPVSGPERATPLALEGGRDRCDREDGWYEGDD